MEILLWVCVVVFVLTAIFAADRQLWLKEIKKDLLELYGDALVARDACDPKVKVHYAAHVRAIKNLIQNHFTL
jgi:hypothetical protein